MATSDDVIGEDYWQNEIVGLGEMCFFVRTTMDMHYDTTRRLDSCFCIAV